jgi:hypothetical protein
VREDVEVTEKSRVHDERDGMELPAVVHRVLVHKLDDFVDRALFGLRFSLWRFPQRLL